MTIPTEILVPRHGGDLAHAQARYGTPPDGWLDLSTGINPVPYPAPPIDPASLAALPDMDALGALIAAARETYRVPSDTGLVAAPGSEIALRLLPCVLPDGEVAIVGPTYGSHYEAWSASRQTVGAVATLDEVPANVTNVILANPNNPDGRAFPCDDLARLASTLAARGSMLIIDEAFADLDPGISLVSLLDRAPAVVLRSFGKFFGLAGLRLGFAAGPATVIDRLARLLGDWPVSNAAIAIGRAALSDRVWQAETRSRLALTASRLRALLARHGLKIAGGTDLFVLVEHPGAARIHVGLAETGLLTRTFPYRHDWLRLGLPSDDTAFARLDAALGSIAGVIGSPKE
jgi:cobalamin biosynthesis protein CobC